MILIAVSCKNEFIDTQVQTGCAVLLLKLIFRQNNSLASIRIEARLLHKNFQISIESYYGFSLRLLNVFLQGLFFIYIGLSPLLS